MRIYAIHLLNDYSGSPKVLMQLINGWIANGHEIHLLSSQNKSGFLSNLEVESFHSLEYKLADNKMLKLFNFIICQLHLFFYLIFNLKKGDLLYINTVLPFGAALVGKLKGCRTIYHIHETSITPVALKNILFGIAKWSATEVVYVSKFIAQQEPLNIKSHILYNAIEAEFLNEAIKMRRDDNNRKNVLMVCSLRDYKGVPEFLDLSKRNAHFNFKLVVNASNPVIDAYFKNIKIPKNCIIYGTQTNLHSFYLWASIILNLSRPDEWIETFGLTIIEGMSYGLPAIVPPVGGITELVKENHNGFLVDCRNTDKLDHKLNALLKQENEYRRISANAAMKINEFSEEVFIRDSLKIINNP